MSIINAGGVPEMNAQDLIDRDGMREDLLAMAERADAIYERSRLNPRLDGYWRRLDRLEAFRGECLDAISLMREGRGE